MKQETEGVKEKAAMVAILDAGAQYGKIIDRRIRELAVESVLLPLTAANEELKEYGAIIISGGPESVYGENAPEYNGELFNLGIPILGICYGMQLINYVFGGTVEKKAEREDGPFTIEVKTDSLLFEGLDAKQEVLLTHGDTVEAVAAGFRVTAMSGDKVAGLEDAKRAIYGVQFHPEVDLTKHGKVIFANFLFKIAKLDPGYTMEDREEKAIAYIKEKVGKKKALVLVSGGVDSAVAATLVTKAIGKEKVIAIHIDNGLMREGESALVCESLKKVGVDVKLVKATETFLKAKTKVSGRETPELREAMSPEEKRKIIGDTFIRVMEETVVSLGLKSDDFMLVQGSLRPDLIESASTSVSRVADTIKTHHNDTQLVRELREAGRVIEPLADYHKDEVRELGKKLGLPDEIVWRQPFPGPGLAIRILCADGAYITDRFAEVTEALKKLSTPKHTIVPIAVRTVGVQGDGRTYSYIAGVTGEENWEELIRLARAIPKSVHSVNRVVYVFGEKVTEPVIWMTKTRVDEESLKQLRAADSIANEILLKYGLMREISQMPVILFPATFGEKGKRSIGIRTIITNDFMTGVPAIPGKEMPIEVLKEMVEKILKEVPGISRVVYDLTSKPPGTTEWE